MENKINKSEYYYNLGILEAKKMNMQLCEKYIKKAIEENEKNAKAHYYLADLYFIKQDFTTGNKYLKNAILNESNKDYKKYYTAMCFYYNKRSFTTIDLLKDIISENDSFFEAYYMLGIIYSVITHYTKAISNFEKVIELSPQMVAAINYSAKNHFMLKNFNTSIDLYKKSLEVEPNNFITKYNLGQSYYYNKEFKKADELYVECSKNIKNLKEYSKTDVKFLSFFSKTVLKLFFNTPFILYKIKKFFNRKKYDYNCFPFHNHNESKCKKCYEKNICKYISEIN